MIQPRNVLSHNHVRSHHTGVMHEMFGTHRTSLPFLESQEQRQNAKTRGACAEPAVSHHGPQTLVPCMGGNAEKSGGFERPLNPDFTYQLFGDRQPLDCPTNLEPQSTDDSDWDQPRLSQSANDQPSLAAGTLVAGSNFAFGCPQLISGNPSSRL